MGCLIKTVKIAEITPREFDEQQIKTTGTVVCVDNKNSIKSYKLADSSGEIWVRQSNESISPKLYENTTVFGLGKAAAIVSLPALKDPMGFPLSHVGDARDIPKVFIQETNHFPSETSDWNGYRISDYSKRDQMLLLLSGYCDPIFNGYGFHEVDY